MAQAGGRSSWIGTQLRVFAVSGLERSHADPFVRLVYTEHTPASDSLWADNDDGGVVRAVESASQVVERLPERRGGRCYTAQWSDGRSSRAPSANQDEECSFELPVHSDWVELQVWNRFFSGFDVFLAKAALSIEQLRAQVGSEDGRRGERQSTGCMWVPLQVPTRNAAPDLRGLKLSAQLTVDFLYDDRVARIRRQMRDRSAAKTGKGGEDVGAPDVGDGESDDNEVADPTFAFTAPFLPVEWSVVAAASVRQLFFYNDVERIAKFRELVLYGDVARELADNAEEDDDYALQVDPGFLAAFRLAQFAAQYLSHCADSLGMRAREYGDQLCSLADAAQSLRHRNRALTHQRKRLEQERDQLALMLKTYKRVGQGVSANAKLDVPSGGDEQLAHVVPASRRSLALEIDNTPSPAKPPASPASSPLSAKKPTFIMTWEERECERQREKDATKAQRVQEEQRWLQQRLEERVANGQRVAEAARQRDRSARVLQCSLRRWLWKLRRRRHHQRRAISTHAAIVIQARVRQWRLTRAFPLVRERLMQESEQRWMNVEDELYRQCLQSVEADSGVVVASPEQQPQQQQIDAVDESSPLEPPETPSKEDVELLVSTWRKIRRAVRREARGRGTNGSSGFRAVFRALDTRRDGVIDRAEMRIGLRQRYRLELDRKLTRGVIALIRGKAGEPPRPLLLTLDQFARGLDLVKSDSVSTSGSSSTSDHRPAVDGDAGVGASQTRSFEDLQPEEGRVALEATLARSPSLTSRAAEEDDCVDRRLKEVAAAVQALRNAVNAAARRHLVATSKLGGAPSYRDFRAVLSHVFASFDSDGNGRLDMCELRTCLASIGVRVTEKNLSLVRECFCSSVSDPGANGDDDTITIAEFISFVLSNSAKKSPTDELGLLGFRVRSAVLDRLEHARTHLDSKGEPSTSEDVLRWVFRSAYPGKRRECPLREFARALRTIKGLETLTPAQVAHVAARLDRDEDQNVSFDELLAWLRLFPASSASTEMSPPAQVLPLQMSEPVQYRAGFRAVLKDAAMRVQWLRECLSQVASALKGDAGAKTYTKTAQASALFDRVDSNGSGKIARDELESFFATLPPELIPLASSNGAADTLAITQQLVDVMDCSGNGVVTRDEWLRFALDPHAPIAEEFAVRVALRSTIESVSAPGDHHVMVSQWLEGLPGALSIADPVSRGATAIHGVCHHKIRVGEFKHAVRKAIEASGSGSIERNNTASSSVVPLVVTAVEAAVKQLDTDGSGWITTNKLLRWLFPTRDLEEVLQLLRSRWRLQRPSERASSSGSPPLTSVQYAEKLYSRFDADGNGCLARRELQLGFRSVFGLEFAEREVDALVAAFDADGDRLWSRSEFLVFAQKVVQSSDAGEDEAKNDSVHAQVARSTDAVERELRVAATEEAGCGSDGYDDDDNPLLLSSSASSTEAPTSAALPSVAASASAAYSGASFQALSGSAILVTHSRKASPLRPTEYDDDFDE